MTPSLKWSIGAILALFVGFPVYADVLISMPYGTQLVNVPDSNGNPYWGATTTAAKAVTAGTVLYMSYCVNMDNGGNGALFSNAVAESKNVNTVFSIPDAIFAGTSQSYCRSATSTAAMNINAGQQYFVSFPVNGVWSFQTASLASSTNNFYELDDSPIVPPADDGTHIIHATPLNNKTIASSSAGTIGALINVNTAQWIQALSQNAGNWFLHITLISPVDTQCGWRCFGAAGALQSTFDFPVNDSGIISLATTTKLTSVGNYKMTIQLIQPSFFSTYLSWFGFSGTVLDSTTTVFTVVKQTGFDTLNSSSTSAIDAFLASSSPLLIASCADFTNFDLADCLNLLFIPQPSTFSYVMADVQGVLLFAPWGYATRIVSIFSGTATSSLPLIAAGIPDPSNPHQYMMFHFDPNEAIAGAAALNEGIVDPVSGDAVMPGIRQIVDTVIALATMSYIFYDLVGGKKHAATHKTKLS